MPEGKPIGDIYLGGQRFTGKRLEGRRLGEQINLPLEGTQGASDCYLVQENDIPAITEAILGSVDDTGKITTPTHYLMNKLYLVDVTFTPYTPVNSIGQEQAGLNVLAEAFNSGQVGGAAAFDLQQQLADKITNAQYGLWRLDMKYEADLGWEEERKGSGKVAAVEVLVPAGGGQKAYTKKLPVPFPESNLSLSKRRVGKFDPDSIDANYQGRINSAAITLPSGRTVAAKHALFQTYQAKFHKQAYGVQYWTVSYELLIQPWPWDQVPQRATGSLVTYGFPAGGSIFQTADFNQLLAA